MKLFEIALMVMRAEATILTLELEELYALLRECTYKDFLNCKPLTFKGWKEWLCCHNSLRRMKQCSISATVAVENQVINVAYAMDWETLKKMITVKYCPRDEIKKLEIELWNLKVKGTYVASYKLCFQELALMYGRMFSEESDEVERYVGGLPDMI
ncbi:putative reverse transcriptase domain-containing protein [Tanacetum coccineum]|uniref:Reverse transcriptase domain-containing protein n=1 Tax=Tanacetum coccineum TaxID=301880 RepID=A0ABQ5C0T3_9ASTR